MRMSKVLAIMIMLIAIAALVLIALMLDYGISTKTLRLLLIALLPKKIERIYAPPACPYYNGYWFINNYDIA